MPCWRLCGRAACCPHRLALWRPLMPLLPLASCGVPFLLIPLCDMHYRVVWFTVWGEQLSVSALLPLDLLLTAQRKRK